MVKQIKHVQLDGNNVVRAISWLNSDESARGLLVVSNEIEVSENYIYDSATQTFSPPEPQPEPEPTPTIDERLEVIEMTSAHTQLQVDYVAFLTEILAMPQ